MRIESQLQHTTKLDIQGDNHPLVEPIHASVKYTFESFEELDKLYHGQRNGYLYSRVLNPTVRLLEKTLASLQGTEDGIALGSGVAAITHTLLSLLQTGDHVIHFYESYAPARVFISKTLAKFGIDHSTLSIDDMEGLKRTLKARKTKIVFFESPTNPTLRIADIESIVRLAKENGALSVLDNTFAGPHQHINLGIDLYIHSLTKYVNGFGETMGGAILGSHELIQSIRRQSAELGAVLDPQSAHASLRSLKTYLLRYKQQSSNAEKVARFLEADSRVRHLSYPGLSTHIDHQLAQKQMQDFGSVITFDVGESKNDLASFIDSLNMIKLTASLGTTESLIAPCALFYSAGLDDPSRCGIRSSTVRLAVGMEDTADIIDELRSSLSCIPTQSLPR